MNNTTLETHPTVNACPRCGKEITQGGRGRPRKFCSRACSNKHWYQESRAAAPRCNEPGCSKPVQARGMCGPHYGEWHRTEGGKERTYTCTGCGIKYTTRRKPQREKGFCTADCQRAHIARDEQLADRRRQAMANVILSVPIGERECFICSSKFVATSKSMGCCSVECDIKRSQLYILKRWAGAEESQGGTTSERVLAAIKSASTITANGCWEWQKVDKAGYPRLAVGDKDVRMHRLVLETKYEAPLGEQVAHHKCANTRCVNPEHLQPVTHRDNVAEMLARHSYLDRIAELEEAIRELAPNHEVLNRVPIK